LNGKIVKVASVNTGANTFQLQDIDGNNINTTGYDAYTSSGTMARIYTLTTPYTTADLPLLKYMQSADVMTLTHRSYAQRELTRTGHAAWTLTTPTFAPTVATPAITSDIISGSGTAQNYYYKATAIDPDTGEESLPTNSYTASGYTDATWNDGEVLTLGGTAAGSVEKVNIYKSRNGLFGFVGQAAVSGGSWTFEDDKILPDTSDAPPESRNPFSGAGNYPQCATYYEQRATYGGSTNRPQG